MSLFDLKTDISYLKQHYWKASQEPSMTISGIDKELVGEVAARIRALKKPEPYKGKGIHYRGEIIRRKAGKKAVASAG